MIITDISKLTKKSEKVYEITQEIVDICKQLKKECLENNGVGLAAPQLGYLYRIIYIKAYDICLINPEITSKEGIRYAREGCLSLPNQTFLVERPTKVKVVSEILELRRKGFKFRDLDAAVVCHEIDHLDGITIDQKALL